MIAYGLDSRHLVWACWVDGLPLPKRETQTGYNPKRGHYAYPDKDVENWKAAIVAQCRAEMTEKIFPIAGPTAMHLIIFRPTKKYDNLSPHILRPDFDNMTKPVCDALQKAGVISDDKIIYSATTTKVWATESPGVWIKLFSCVAGIELITGKVTKL